MPRTSQDSMAPINFVLPIDGQVRQIARTLELLWARQVELSQKTLGLAQLQQNVVSGDLDLSQYLYMPGRVGGQSINGGTGSAEDLNIAGSSHADGGAVNINSTTTITKTDSVADAVVYPLVVVHEVSA